MSAGVVSGMRSRTVRKALVSIVNCWLLQVSGPNRSPSIFHSSVVKWAYFRKVDKRKTLVHNMEEV
jgi:hypothetical protein